MTCIIVQLHDCWLACLLACSSVRVHESHDCWRTWLLMCMIVHLLLTWMGADVYDCWCAWLLKCMIVHLPSSSHVWLFTYLIREIIKMFMHLSKPVANLNGPEKRNDPWIIVHFQDCWPVWLSMCNISLCMIYCVYDCFRKRYVCVYDCLRPWLFTHMIVNFLCMFHNWVPASLFSVRLSVNFSYFVSEHAANPVSLPPSPPIR